MFEQPGKVDFSFGSVSVVLVHTRATDTPFKLIGYECSSLRICSNFPFQKIFDDAVKTDQNPQNLDDESGKIEAVKQRKSDQPGPQTIQNGIKQAFASDALGLQENIGENDDADAG